MHQNQAKLFHENNTKSYITYVTITYFNAPECIKLSQKLPKITYFQGVTPTWQKYPKHVGPDI